jgi:hypothetical protein
MAPRRSYEIVVSGRVGNVLAEALAPLTAVARDGQTTISGENLDAAMLAGVLRVIEKLGLELIAVRSFVEDSPDRA